MLATRHSLPATALLVLAFVYAFLAGLRTVGDFDIGWQLATGRYILQHKTIPSVDVFSYTGAGQPWRYPPFCGVLFYLLWLMGGFSALSWASALATAGTVALLVAAADSRCRAVAAALAILAVPLIAFRTKPRADLFTTLLFAAVLALLWRRYCNRSAAIWLLPVLMCAWANLHLGFTAGLLLCGLYMLAELLQWATSPDLRPEIARRLRSAIPWLAAAGAATLINPFGAGVYGTIYEWNALLKALEGHIGDWFAVPVSSSSLAEALDWRSPSSAYWWMLALAFAGIVTAFAVRLWGAALLLAFFAWSSLRYLRFQALLAIVTVIVLPDVVRAVLAAPALQRFRTQVALEPTQDRSPASPRENSARGERGRDWQFRIATVFLVIALAALASVRSADLLSQRHYLADPDTIRFGVGASWWYPQRAAEFVRRERLPGRILNDFNLGGYVIWSLAPEYADAMDGRCLPFGAAGIFENKILMAASPDSRLWESFANRWQVNTLIIPTSRYAGAAMTVAALCSSRAWRPVYLDESGGVFVRVTPENQTLIERLAINCAAVALIPPPHASTADVYNFWANAGNLLHALGRRGEAMEALNRARRIFDGDPQLHLIRGSVWQAAERLAEAEAEYRGAVALRGNDQTWYALGQLLAVRGHYAESAEYLRWAAGSSAFPHEIYRFLGHVLLAEGKRAEALRAFDEAEARNPYRGFAAPLGVQFRADLEAGRSRARQ